MLCDEPLAVLKQPAHRQVQILERVIARQELHVALGALERRQALLDRLDVEWYRIEAPAELPRLEHGAHRRGKRAALHEWRAVECA